MKTILIFLISVLLAATSASAQIASGENYALSQAVVTAGGGTSGDAGNIYRVEGTSGQAAAGVLSGSGPFRIFGGFWTPDQIAPTASTASVSGRVAAINNKALSNVSVALTGGTLSAPRLTRTNTFGNFLFADLEIGQTYIITVAHRRYGFSPNSQVLTLTDSVNELVFEATWEN